MPLGTHCHLIAAVVVRSRRLVAGCLVAAAGAAVSKDTVVEVPVDCYYCRIS